jgi:threonine/homoserine/homoserine lactone efflux protein
MTVLLTILIGIALLSVLGVLVAGLVGLARGGSDVSGNPARSNTLMRWRVVLQGVALVLFALLLALTRHGS